MFTFIVSTVVVLLLEDSRNNFLAFCTSVTVCVCASSGKFKNINYFLKNMSPRVGIIGGLVVYLAGL